MKENSKSEKVKRITEIRQRGKEPIIEILTHGLEDEESAFKVEAAVIDLIDIDNLTNIVKGKHSSLFGRMPLEVLLQKYKNEKAVITEPSVLFKIQQKYTYGLDPQKLYDFTRGTWKLSNRRNKAKYAFSIYDNMIQEVYKIASWFPGGTTFLDKSGITCEGRWEFVGSLASDKIRNKYLNKSVEHYFSKGNQNPIKYINID